MIGDQRFLIQEMAHPSTSCYRKKAGRIYGSNALTQDFMQNANSFHVSDGTAKGSESTCHS